MRLVAPLAFVSLAALAACSKSPSPTPAPVTSAAPDVAASAPAPAEDAAASAPAPADAGPAVDPKAEATDAGAVTDPKAGEAATDAGPAAGEAGDAGAATEPKAGEAAADAGAATNPQAAEAPPCIPLDGTADGPSEPKLEGATYAFCVSDLAAPPETGNRSCFHYDLATEALTRVPATKPAWLDPVEPPKVREGKGWKIDVEGKAVSVCAGADCQPLATDGKEPNPEGEPSLSEDGTMIAVTLHDPATADGLGTVVWVYVYDVATQKRLAKKKVSDESFICGGAHFVGNTVLVALDVCAGPGGKAWLAEPKSLKKIADVGGKDFGGYDPQWVHLDGDRYLFLEQGGRSVAAQDVKTGKVSVRLDLSENYPIAYDARDVPAYGGALLAKDGGGFVVALAGSATDKVLELDATGGKVEKVHTLPHCPTPPATP